MKLSARLCLVLVAFSIAFIGCDDGENPTTLDLTVEVASLKIEDRQAIDRVEIVVVGLESPLKFTETAAVAFENGAATTYVVSSEAISLKADTVVYVRASVYAGDVEVSGQTKRLTLKPNAGSTEEKFALLSFASPNGCRVSRSAAEVTLPEGSDVKTFDIAAGFNNDFLLAYSNLTSTNGDVFTVKLDSSAAVASAPIRLTSVDSRSIHPTLAKTSAGFMAAWQSSVGVGTYSDDYNSPDTPYSLEATHLNQSGQIISGTSVLGASVHEVHPSAAALANGTPALAWHDRLGGMAQWHDRVGVALPGLNGVNGSITGLLDWHGMGSAKNVTNIALASTYGYWGAVWSDKGNGSNHKLMFQAMSANLAKLYEFPLSMYTSDARHAAIVGTSFGYVAAWEDTAPGSNTQIHVSAVGTLDGMAQPESGPTEGTYTTLPAYSPKLAWNNSIGTTALVYTQLRDENEGGSQIFMTRLTGAGGATGVGDVQVSKTLDTQAVTPRAVATGDGFLIVWAEEKAGAPSKLMSARVSCNP